MDETTEMRYNTNSSHIQEHKYIDPEKFNEDLEEVC
jgi:hypothetical protein